MFNAPIKMDVYELQAFVEAKFAKRNIAGHVRDEILNTDGIDQILDEGVSRLTEYINTDYSYASKNERIAQLADYELCDIVIDVIGIILLLTRDVQLTQVVGQVSEKLHFTNKADGAKCSAEILAILWDLGLYEIYKEEKYSSMMIRSGISPSEKLQDFINSTKFLPPMICPPNILTKNTDSAYLSRREPLILGGSVNFHEQDICLDSLNKFNQIPLTLNLEVLKLYSEKPSKKIEEDPKKMEQWEAMVQESYETYLDLVKQGNRFYLTHGVDKRGRTYARGYHVSTQGNSFRKAIVDLAVPELIEG